MRMARALVSTLFVVALVAGAVAATTQLVAAQRSRAPAAQGEGLAGPVSERTDVRRDSTSMRSTWSAETGRAAPTDAVRTASPSDDGGDAAWAEPPREEIIPARLGLAAACCYTVCAGGPNGGNACASGAQCPLSSCAPQCQILSPAACAALNGFYHGPPNRATPILACGGLCNTGSCCAASGCADEVPGPGPMTFTACELLGGEYKGGIRCFGGSCVGGTRAGLSCDADGDCPLGSCGGGPGALDQPSPCPPYELTSVAIRRAHFAGNPSEIGVVDVQLAIDPNLPQGPNHAVGGPTDALHFLNVFADCGTGPQWVTRNVPLLIVPGTGNNGGVVRQQAYFELPLTAVTCGDIDVYVTDAAQLGVPTLALAAGSSAGGAIGVSHQLLSGGGGRGFHTATTPQNFGSPLQSSHFNPVPALVIKDFKLRLNVPDYKQDQNNADRDTGDPGAAVEDNRGHDECGPTATANSIRWLVETYGLEGAPAETPGGNTEDDDLITELVECMDTNGYKNGPRGTCDGGANDGNPCSGPADCPGGACDDGGTNDEDMVNGKLECIKKWKLPLCVEFQDGDTVINGQAAKAPTPEWIWDQLNKGQDVELGFTFDDGGGHWVTLVGGIHWGDGTYGVYVNDPDDGDAGPAQYYNLEKRKVGGVEYLEMKGYGARHFIDIAVAESPKFDPHVTPSLPGLTFATFGSPETPPIPADFFDPGSDPFTGQIDFRGRPIDPSTYGAASTLVMRSANPVAADAPNGANGVVDIELVALSLASLNPITVTYNGGMTPEPWNVDLSLSHVPAPTGSLSATKTHPNGGTFDATLFVRPVFVFTSVNNPAQVRVLDTGLTGDPPIELTTTAVPWVHTAFPGLGLVAPFDGEFVPGVREVTPGNPASQTLEYDAFADVDTGTRHEVGPPPEPDPHATASNPLGSSFVVFGSGPNPVIPADFFFLGSPPFNGMVPLRGASAVSSLTRGNATTLVHRSGPPISPGAPSGAIGTVDIEIVQLNLQSLSPINVGGTFWHVRVTLSDVPSPVGTMMANKTHANRGMANAFLPVRPKFTFTSALDPNDVRVLDTGLTGGPPVNFSASGIPWVHTVNPALGVIAPHNGTYVTGILEAVPGNPGSQQLVSVTFVDGGSTQHTIEPPTPPDPHATVQPSSVSFASSPIPAGFFGPGSDPFLGALSLEGLPLDRDALGNASVLVQRGGAPIAPNTPPPANGQVPIEIVALSLQSVGPAIVSYNGGTEFRPWEMHVELSDTPSPPGQLNASKTHPNGGVFNAQLNVLPKFTFTSLPDRAQVVVLDAGQAGGPLIQFTANNVPWVHAVGPGLELVAPNNGIFVAGVNETIPGDPMSQITSVADFVDPAGPTEHSVEPPRPDPEPDPHGTVEGPALNLVTFGGGSVPPLPPGFFDPGSDPFLGTVEFRGAALGSASEGDTSAKVQRTAHPVAPGAPPGASGTVEIELVELSLVSLNPITVTTGGMNPEPWQVRVGLSTSVRPPRGELTAQKTHANGGFFDVFFYVTPRFTFVKLNNPQQIRVLDLGDDFLPALRFEAVGVPWVHTANPALGLLAPNDGHFVPGVNEVLPGVPASQQLASMTAEDELGPTRHTVGPVVIEPPVVTPDPPAAAEAVCFNGTTPTTTPCTQHSDCPPGQACRLKSRFLSIDPADTGGSPVALRVRVLTVPNAPAAVNGAPYNYPAMVGDTWWVGAATTRTNDQTNYITAPLECTGTPLLQDWNAVGIVHIYGHGVVPGARYEISACAAVGGPCSAPLALSTTRYGDTAPLYNAQNFTDVSAMVSEFQNANAPSSLRKPHAWLTPSLLTPGGAFGFDQISASVVGFQGGPPPSPPLGANQCP